MMSALTFQWLAEVLLGTLLKVTVLAAFALAVLWSLRHASAAKRHFVSRTAAVGLLLIPAASLILPDWSRPGLGEWTFSGIEAPAEVGLEAPKTVESPYATKLVSAPSSQAMGDSWSSETPKWSSTPIQKRQPSRALGLLVWAGWTWLVGCLFFVVRFAAAWWRVARIAGSARPVEDSGAGEALRETSSELAVATPALRQTASIRVPVLWGVSEPVMLLPAEARDWTPARMRLVFQHELAHLKRRDPLWLFVERVAQAVYWFHPLVWWIERKSRQDCEKACDDLVLNQGALASDYARQLLCIARALNPKPLPKGVTLAMARTNSIEDRLVAILDPRLRRQAPSPRFAKVVLLAAALLILPLSTLRVVARQGSGAGQAKKYQYQSETQYKDGRALKEKMQKEERLETGEDWFGHAMRLHQEDRFEEAIQGFQTAADKGYRSKVALYNIACGYSMLDNADQALHFLAMALDAGFDRFDLLLEDSDLDPIRSDSRFAALLDRSLATTTGREPDRLNEALRQFEYLQSERSQDGSEWASAGLDLLRLRQLDRSISALSTAADLLPGSNSTQYYNLACAFALRGDRGRAMDFLDQAIDSGFDNQAKLAYDPDLRSVRSEARFSAIQDRAYDLSLSRFRVPDKDRESKQQWAPAVEFYSAYVRSHPDSGRAWFNLGYAQHYSGLHPQAVDSFQRAVARGYRPPVSLYNVACAYARSNQIDQAFAFLERAEAAGFNIGGYLGDEDLNNLHGDPRFDALEKRAEKDNFEKKMERKTASRKRRKN